MRNISHETLLSRQEILGDCGPAAIQTQGSTSNPFGMTYVYGYQNVAFEVKHFFNIPNSVIVILVIYACVWKMEIVKRNFMLCWGQYLQVMKNGHIATITLFQS